jgi:F0F1-type ATP synthase gamma subunit
MGFFKRNRKKKIKTVWVVVDSDGSLFGTFEKKQIAIKAVEDMLKEINDQIKTEVLIMPKDDCRRLSLIGKNEFYLIIHESKVSAQ